MASAACPRCARSVGLHEGRPFVTAAGEVELWHRACHEARLLPTIADPVFVAPPRPSRRKHWLIGGAAAASAALVVIAISQWTWAVTREPPDAALPNVDTRNEEALSVKAAQGVREPVPPHRERIETAVSDHFEVPNHTNGQPLDEAFYTLRGWVHPIAGASELVPPGSRRWFGAERHGIERAECGAGHCGVDLHGNRGDPIIAVASGVVVRVERRPDGGDGISGRWVRIRHQDGAFSVYMHLDAIDRRLEVGDTIYAGQYLGDLGSSGVAANAPHLHFALELPANPEPDVTQHVSTRYVDPAPFLARSRVVEASRAHAIKPAF